MSIVATTAFDRLNARFDRWIRPPKTDRKLCLNPFSAINEVSNIPIEDLDRYRLDLKLSNLFEQIDVSLRKNLPVERYAEVKEWRNFGEWINILVSLYCLVRATKPEIIVETGIGEIGMTSTFLLRGLEDNNGGELYSIDPDKFYPIYGYHVGRGIPDYLKHRQTGVIGLSQDKLEPLLVEKGPIDLFLHDGDHKYRTKFYEYEVSYAFLNKSGFIISDDSWDSSFDIFASKYKLNNCSVKYGKNDFFSFARKGN